MSNFFDSNTYFIDEKVNMFKFENEYKVYGENGELIGAIKQKLTTGQKVLRLFLKKPMLPFLLEIRNAEGGLEGTISRGWTFWMSKIVIADANNTPIGIIKQKFKFFKPTFTIFTDSEVQLAQITGDWKAWNFVIKDANQAPIGAISKKWAGAVKELFTTADKYNVTISGDVTDKKSKAVIISAAITIDMVLKESK
ncbi:phospholipid scramblase-related protein [Flavobacterium sp. RHBU_24]|uniref:phospholipid scramblase-related protein n=1 Tax=Flavobacterium sp. RHBU_24 TaxID=3391185 RepID=UPI003984EC21